MQTRRLRLSISALLLMGLVAAVAIFSFASEYRENQQREFERIQHIAVIWRSIESDEEGHISSLGCPRIATIVSDADMPAIGSLGRLKSLMLTWQVDVTDSGIRELIRCSELTMLDLSFNENITNKSVPYLKQLPKLDYLSISGTGIDENGIAELKSSQPDLVIDHE